jgi:hypothetical protein
VDYLPRLALNHDFPNLSFPVGLQAWAWLA